MFAGGRSVVKWFIGNDKLGNCCALRMTRARARTDFRPYGIVCKAALSIGRNGGANSRGEQNQILLARVQCELA